MEKPRKQHRSDAPSDCCLALRPLETDPPGRSAVTSCWPAGLAVDGRQFDLRVLIEKFIGVLARRPDGNIDRREMVRLPTGIRHPAVHLDLARVRPVPAHEHIVIRVEHPTGADKGYGRAGAEVRAR
jgi:hypothetical protein